MVKNKRSRNAKHIRTQSERSEATTRALITAATSLFATNGFAGTSLDDILGIAMVTRGALYHHFESKTDLFRAVFEEQEQALSAVIVAAASGARDAWTAFRRGCEAFLTACLDPVVQRIILIDAPAVLGWEVMREIESRYALAMLRSGLERAIAEGKISRRPVEPLAHLLLGALSECAMAIARAPDAKATMQEARRELDRLLTALAKS
ncbi:MAG: TetR family transcriptional regulator [Acidobacteriota bacterium]